MHAKQVVLSTELIPGLYEGILALIHHPKQIEDTLIPVRKLNKTKSMCVPYIYIWSLAIFLNYVSIGSLNSLDVMFHKITDYQIFLVPKTGSLDIALAILELTMETMLALFSQISSCLCHQRVEIKSVCHHTHPTCK